MGAGVPANGRERTSKSTFKPIYPKKGWDFPRRSVEIKPSEILYDPTRILGSYVWARLKSTGRTVVNQPRVESTELIQETHIDDTPYPSQLPYIKRQIHLDPSRDAEILTVSGRVDVPASGSQTVFSFATFNNLRTIIKWINISIFDALDPVMMTVQFLIDGVPKKIFACDPKVTISGGGYAPIVRGAVSTNTNCLPCLPSCCDNTLWEITDHHMIECIARNSAPADRKIEVCLWGWIESVTAWDTKVLR